MQICHAYLTRMDFIETPNKFFETIELAVLDMADQLDAKQAIILLNSMAVDASTELVEVFDRIIGANVD